MIDLNAAQVFVRVVRAGSFIAAARAMEMPRSTVSARVAALEHQLGVRLMRRTTRKLILTEEGQVYFAAAAPAVDALLAATPNPQAAGGHVGSIRLTAPPEYPTDILRRAVLDFRDLNPRVRFDVLLTNEPLDLVENGIDLAVRGAHPGAPGLATTKLGDVPFGLFASPDYLKRKGRPATSDDLRGHELLAFAGSGGRRLPGLDLDIPAQSIGSDSLTFLKQLAAEGAGIAALPRHLCSAEVEAGELQLLLPDWTGAEIASVYLVFPSRRDISTRVRAFADQLRSASREFTNGRA